MLRDIVRNISNGNKDYEFNGTKVALIDERNEISGSYLGIPQMNIGIRTDVMIRIPQKLALDYGDIGVLYGNLLDNAIGRDLSLAGTRRLVTFGIKLHGVNLLGLTDMLTRRSSCTSAISCQAMAAICIDC